MHRDNPLPDEFMLAEANIELVAKGIIVCTAISGACGLGKTYLTEKTLRRFGVSYRLVQGSGAGLLLAAYEFRKGGVLIIDDADNLVTGGGVGQANLMKQLLNPMRERHITNNTKEAHRNQESENPKAHIPPPAFTTRCGVVWLTNINTKDTSQISAKMRPHIDALIDRGLDAIRLSDDPRWKLDYVLSLVTDGGLFRNFTVPCNGGDMTVGLAATNDIVGYFVTNAWRLPTISVRQIIKIATKRVASPLLWERLLNQDLLPAPLYSYPLPPIPIIKPQPLHLAS